MVRSCTLSFMLLMATCLAGQSQSPTLSGTLERLVVHFSKASAELNASDSAALHALCQGRNVAGVKSIALKGHTDEHGSVAYNKALSERRAMRVREVLASTCLKDKAVTVEWSGESDPISRDASEMAYAGNRRVEVLLISELHVAVEAREEGHSKVVPLMPLVDKPREHFTMDASQAIDLTASDGVRVRIPAGAIMDASGRPVNGPVQISYRSFNEPYEIIASGIPMHVGTDEGLGHFETAGMYELYASLDNTRLALAPGATISLERPEGPGIASDFTGWVLDPSSGSWVSGGTITNTSTAPIAPSLVTEATGVYWNRLWQLQSEKRPDSMLFAERRQASNYCHLTACDTAAPGASWVKKRDRFEEVDRVPEIRVFGYKGIYDQDRVVFTVKIEGDDDQQFPEWRRLPHKAVWEYRGSESRAVFKRLYGRRHLFQDIDLVLEPGTDDGTLRLKENGIWLELPISAKWNRNTPREELRWDNALALYNKALSKRSRNFDRDVQRKVDRYARQHKDLPATAWKHAHKAMDDAERTMDLTAWVNYADTRRPVQSRWGVTTQRDLTAVQTTFGLENFGVYNIDRIMKMADQQNVLAATTCPDGKPFPWVNGFAVLTNENSVITYWGGGSGLGDNFLVAPGKMKSLFLVDGEGNIARADVTPLNSREARVVLQVTPMQQPTNMEELRAQAE